MKYYVSPFYGVSKAVAELYATDKDMVFVMADEDSPIVPAQERASWLLHTLHTTTLELTGFAENIENDDYFFAADSVIRKHMLDNEIESAEVIFEVMDERAFKSIKDKPFGKNNLPLSLETSLDRIVLEDLLDSDMLDERFVSLFGDRIKSILNPTIPQLEVSRHVLFPRFEIKGNEFVLALFDIKSGTTVPFVKEVDRSITHVYFSELYTRILVGEEAVPVESFFKFVSLSDGNRYMASFLDLGDVGESVLADVANGTYVSNTPTTVLRILPLESVKTLSPDFALLHNVYVSGMEQIKSEAELSFEVV